MAQSNPNIQLRLGVFRFGSYDGDFRVGELRKSGVRIKIQDQPLQVLDILLKHPGELVTREQLRQRLWPADTFVDFDHSLNSAVKKLRLALCDDAETPRFIETLARRGYRFIGPITREEAKLAKIETSTAKPEIGRSRWYRWWIPVTSLLAAMILIIAIMARNQLWRRSGTNPRPIESVAVLPLQNLSSEPQQEYFADGLTDSLITSLGKLGTMRVISRTSVMRVPMVRHRIIGVQSMARLSSRSAATRSNWYRRAIPRDA